MMTFLKFIAERFVRKAGKGNPNTIDAEFLRNYALANKRGSEDDFIVLNMMCSRKPDLYSTTESREYRAPSEYCTESLFARDCLAAELQGAWDAEVGRPIPEMASDAYRKSYSAKRDRMAAENV
ncbi:hypothetical protein ELH67_09445 [Rhizobium ruizarguesonis]|uniref:hypothetical protein n=1 Tax=Rhizobium ruizarguesonis TaxID=2081791 RepID=UPI001031DFC1|nr:hypothetical protein [Rhizobium ruizarguesonis]TAZ94750.1 hypothetical protein ELH67_09445 [Rhizobium ruizarguesonis]TBA37636.1 hypothetical protein ELH60_09445 [Rhizobium ruizarguesonis]TBC62986.1 hypothetical protein ELH36_09450 [Rhizobium ruizarguesonis]